jgi:hypothetical protein
MNKRCIVYIVRAIVLTGVSLGELQCTSRQLFPVKNLPLDRIQRALSSHTVHHGGGYSTIRCSAR